MSATWNDWEDCIWIGTQAECIGGPVDGEFHVVRDEIMTIYHFNAETNAITTHLYKYDAGKYHYIGTA